MLFHIIFSRPRLLPATSKSNALFHHLFKTCSYHHTPVALASPSKVSFKPSKFISSWLLFSMILTSRIAFIMAFSFSKFPIHSPLDLTSRSHTALQILHNSDKFFLSFLPKIFSHEVTPHILQILFIQFSFLLLLLLHFPTGVQPVPQTAKDLHKVNQTAPINSCLNMVVQSPTPFGLGWVEMAVGLPEGPSYPRHSPSFFCYVAPEQLQ